MNSWMSSLKSVTSRCSRVLHWILFILLITACGQADLGTPTAVPPAPTGTVSLPTSASRAETTPTPTLTGLEKGATEEALFQTAEVQIADARATDLAYPTQSPAPLDPYTIPTEVPVPTWVAGLSGLWDCYHEGDKRLFAMQNCWRGQVNGEYMLVESGYEGRFGVPTPTGEVVQGGMMVTLQDSPHDHDPQYEGVGGPYWSPVRAGALVILAVTPPRALVQADDGTQFVFNLETRQWEDPSVFPTPAPTSTAPTDTPTPPAGPTDTPTPTATPASGGGGASGV